MLIYVHRISAPGSSFNGFRSFQGLEALPVLLFSLVGRRNPRFHIGFKAKDLRCTSEHRPPSLYHHHGPHET